MPLRLALIAICVSASVSVVAQVRFRPTETGLWRPWSFTAVAHARQSRGATTAEVRAFEARLQELAAIVKGAPAVSPPIGFAGELWGSLNSHYPEAGQPPGRAVPLAGALSFGAFPLIEFTRDGRLVNEDLKGGETELLQFEVVHPAVENAKNQDARIVGLEEDAVAAACGHQDARPEVVACVRGHGASNQALHRVAKSVDVPAGLILAPRPNREASNRGEIRPGDLGEDEPLHRLANRASTWSSVSSSITRAAATS